VSRQKEEPNEEEPNEKEPNEKEPNEKEPNEKEPNEKSERPEETPQIPLQPSDNIAPSVPPTSVPIPRP